MNKNTFAFALIALSAFYSTTAFSEEKSTGLPNDYGQISTYELQGKKDECLIVATNCVTNGDTVQMRAERLKKEIDKGMMVYTPEELKVMEEQLNWIKSESGN